jgi:ABC-type Mn2+/Zn2+ transport system ATPase subunit
MPYEKDFDFEAHIDNLVEISENIEEGKITILTGSNGYGKSLIRKLLGLASPNMKVASVSMERRTSHNLEYGALSGLAMDDPWVATSVSTYRLIKALLKTEERFLVIDEPEIGMSKEVLLGFINKLLDIVKTLRDEGKFKGLLIITHNDFFVKNMKYDRFINIEGFTLSQWQKRKIVPIDPEDLVEWTNKMHAAVQARINGNKEAKGENKK